MRSWHHKQDKRNNLNTAGTHYGQPSHLFSGREKKLNSLHTLLSFAVVSLKNWYAACIYFSLLSALQAEGTVFVNFILVLSTCVLSSFAFLSTRL